MAILLGLISGLSDAVKNALAKRNTTEFDEVLVTWAWVTFAAVFLSPLLLISGVPNTNTNFWIALLLVTLIDFIAYYLYTVAIKVSDLSLTLPMLAFTPLFVLLSSVAINQEYPNIWGISGVFLVVGGAYILNYQKNNHAGLESILGPVFRIIADRGSLYMLIVALIWGLAGSLHKYAINNSDDNAIFYAFMSLASVAIAYTVIVLIKQPRQVIESLYPENLKLLAPVGFMEGVTVLTQMITQGLSLAAFAISLKRTSIIFSAVLGWKFFGENIRARLIPIILIVIGVILIALQ